MIELYEGRLGAGKTYHAVVRAVDHWKQGLVVCSNVEFRWENVKAYCLRKFEVHLVDEQYIALSDEQIGLFHQYTPSGTKAGVVLVIVDEAHLVFNSRDWANTHKNFKETLTFLTQSRKVATDVIFIAQSVANMDKQFMRLVQYIWRFRDLSKWRIPVLMIRYPFQTLLAVQYDYDGKTILKKNFHPKDTDIFTLYNTDSLLREFPRLSGVATKHVLKKADAKKIPTYMKLLIPLLIVAALFGGWKLYQSTKGGSTSVVASSTGETMQKALAPKVSPARNVNVSAQGDASSEDVVGQGAYDIYAERFVAWSQPDKSLHTEKTWYTLGEMSPRGYVTAISDRRVKVLTPAGRVAWVVASKDHVAPAVSPSPSSALTPPSASAIVMVNGQTAEPSPRVQEPSPSAALDGYERALRNAKSGRLPRPTETPRVPDR
jgi:zona occludens toxin (predicted ATPase)